jgi:hypothetical protein
LSIRSTPAIIENELHVLISRSMGAIYHSITIGQRQSEDSALIYVEFPVCPFLLATAWEAVKPGFGGLKVAEWLSAILALAYGFGAFLIPHVG